MDPSGLFDHLESTDGRSDDPQQRQAGPSTLTPAAPPPLSATTDTSSKAARKEARHAEREARKKRDRSREADSAAPPRTPTERNGSGAANGESDGNAATVALPPPPPKKHKKHKVVNGDTGTGSTGANPLTVETAPVLTDEFVAEASRNLPAEKPAGEAAKDAKVVKTEQGAGPASVQADRAPTGTLSDGATPAAAAAAAAAEVAGGVIGTSVSGPSAGAAAGSMEIRHSVRHQVALPPAYPYVPLSSHVPPEKPAREWPFTLDPFQRTAIASIQRGESVLVSAHTSAGKTVVAEYAIAQCLKEGQRVVYTSPIKALSNQKYREMSAEFGDVGLMTGDVTINPSASCLVMTTEILRSMLYRGSEIMREVAWVVFDEIHYMRDKERGVVWEETIILLPRKVRYVFLSATIPNAMQFASWIAHTHQQPCHVVYTDFRPTPLQHYLFPLGAEGIHLVVDEAGRFREDNFQAAMGALNSARGEDPASVDGGSGKGRKGQTRKGGATKGPSDIYKIVRMIMVKNYNPVIVFAFSKRECEGLALQMAKLEFNNDDEKNMVGTVFNNAITALSEEDRALPQIEHLLPLLRRGIGIHHGGLLPILKEVIEILFQEGLIKVLFATETFSIGLNMPAKTVVFTSVRKFDGTENRNLTSGEFIQMSGRAGRRGLDDRGIVIMMFDEKLEPADAKTMVKGEADRLNSAFHLGYNMILNLMRVEGISPEYMLERCFFQFQSAASVPELEGKLASQRKELEQAVVPDEEQTEEYFALKHQLQELQSDVREVVTHPTYALPFLQPGRLAHVQHEDLDFGWGIVIRYQKRITPSRGGKVDASASERPQSQWIVDVLLDCEAGSTAPTIKDVATRAQKQVKGADTAPLGLRPCPSGKRGEMLAVPVLLSTISRISGVRLKMSPDLRSREARDQARTNLLEVKRRFAGSDSRGKGVPVLDPVKDMKIADQSFATLLSKIRLVESRLSESKVAALSGKERGQLQEAYEHKQELERGVKSLERQLSDAHSVLQLDELKCRKRVLRRLGFTTDDDVVQKKGRVACEISTGDELLLTEMIFNNVFNDLDPNQCAALLSCFVFDEKSEQQTRLKEDLAGPLRVMQETARRIAKVSIESRLQVNEDEYVASFKVELMEAVLQWCRGAKFSEICKMTDVFEGSLIRVFRRLQELLRQVVQASKAIGNVELQEKFEASQKALERENSIIFSPSLYL